MKDKQKRRKISLNALIFLFVAILSALIITFCSISIYLTSRNTIISMKETNMQNQATVMVNKMVNAGCFFSAGITDSMQVSLNQLASDFDGRVMVIDSSFQVLYDTLGISTGRFILDQRVLNTYNGSTYMIYDTANTTFEMLMPVSYGNNDTRIGMIIMFGSTAFVEEQLRILRGKIILLASAMTLLTLLFAGLGAFFIVRPFRKLKRESDNIMTGSVETINVRTYREVDEVLASFNGALNRLKTLDESRQEFVSNVSHELKTPITSIRVLADSIMSMGDAPVELYKDFMKDISSEVDREAKIINDLLALVKMDKAAATMNIAQININDLINSVMHRLLPIADQRKIELVFESFRDVVCDADETKLSLAISNLVENAIKYNVDGGFVHVSLNADHRYMYIKVQDSGIGIPEDCQSMIFDRFYRVDKARSRETGGTGLGLAITKSVVQMHHGAIKVFSKPGEGTTFSVRIPLGYKEQQT